MIHTLHKLDTVRLAADFSAAVRASHSDLELTAIRQRNAEESDASIDHVHDYTDANDLMAGAIDQQLIDWSWTELSDEIADAWQRSKASGFRLSSILVACEYSATVRDAFAARGHHAVSCDVLPSDNPHGNHYRGDVRDILTAGFDMMIAHPPCTYLSACQLWRCQAKYDKAFPARQNASDDALDFVRDLMDAPIGKQCIENPVGRIGSDVRPASQYVQPYEFGHDHSKRTGLWLDGLPNLVADPADYIAPRQTTYKGKPVNRWGNQSPCGADNMGPSKDRGHKRSKFFSGFAEAMADQWGGIKAAITETATTQPIGQLALF